MTMAHDVNELITIGLSATTHDGSLRTESVDCGFSGSLSGRSRLEAQHCIARSTPSGIERDPSAWCLLCAILSFCGSVCDIIGPHCWFFKESHDSPGSCGGPWFCLIVFFFFGLDLDMDVFWLLFLDLVNWISSPPKSDLQNCSDSNQRSAFYMMRKKKAIFLAGHTTILTASSIMTCILRERISDFWSPFSVVRLRPKTKTSPAGSGILSPFWENGLWLYRGIDRHI